MEPKIVAQQGRTRFLVQVSETEARVLDLDQKQYFEPFMMQSILARGYWTEYTGVQQLPDLLAKVGAA